MSSREPTRSDHLREADQRIALARGQLEEQERVVASRRLSDQEHRQALHLLETMRKTLAAFEAHRDAIARIAPDADRLR